MEICALLCYTVCGQTRDVRVFERKETAMKRLFALIVLLFLSNLLVQAQSTNILLNDSLFCCTSSMPEGWSFDYDVHGICYSDGGPDNSPQVVFSTPEDSPVSFGGFRQQMINLVQGEKYRLSCYVRTCLVGESM